MPTLNTDWWNYGGLTRDVKLIETTATFIEDYFLYLDAANPEQIKGYVQLNGPASGNHPLRLQIPELSVDTTFFTNNLGRTEITFTSENIDYWSVEDPKRYQVSFSSREDQLTDQIGFRSISTREDDILLNGEPVFLKGISIHEESPVRGGRGNSMEDARQLLSWAKELGCNFVRLAHYPHNEHMVRLADEMGILVWEENPVYWTISWDNPETYAQAANQLTELIARDKNRAFCHHLVHGERNTNQ